MADTDTIFALATAPGRGGIAVLRLSGPAARAALLAVTGIVPAARQARRVTLLDPADEGTEPSVIFLLSHEVKSGDDPVLSKRIQAFILLRAISPLTVQQMQRGLRIGAEKRGGRKQNH